MNIKTFIDRPITSIMMAVTLTIIGLIGLIALSIEQYSDIAPPTVRVSASYTGASAEILMKSVVVPLEILHQWCRKHAIHYLYSL